ncbi:GNAT family N-acetyltransferase [Nocardioides stalactiti]|uniref:GNAT family N-acetyltransferase n=1 Tax=Nocardioides stalactiti TaxID=2755356 RepID=UPI0016022066|nr:GNAT family N-acetyltransferase [Nocardioides stalactiti]
MTVSTVQPSLRPVTEADESFLVALYGSTRADLALLPLDPEQHDVLVRMQYRAQDQHYREQHPGASFEVVEVDGAPVGRLYVDRTDRDLRVVDISLLPEVRGRGMGTALLRRVQDEAAASGRSVSLHVASDNPAAALYARLGFRPVADLGAYRRLEWSAP